MEIEEIKRNLDAIEQSIEGKINTGVVNKVADLEKEIAMLNTVVTQIEPLANDLVKKMVEAKAIIATINDKIGAMKATVKVEPEVIKEVIKEVE